MIPILSHFLSDNESLFEYERAGNSFVSMDLGSVCRRLVAAERMYNTQSSDMYYEGLQNMYLSTYQNFSELIWKLPYSLSKEYFVRIGDKLYVKSDSFESWMNTITHIPPLLVIAASFLDNFSLNILRSSIKVNQFIKKELQQFKYTAQLKPYIPDLNYFVQSVNGLHDLHIHLNGSTETDVIWNYILNHIYETVKDYQQMFQKNSVRKLSEQIISDFTPETLLNRLLRAQDLRVSIIQRLFVVNRDRSDQTIDSLKKVTLCNLWGEVSRGSQLNDLTEELLFYILVLYQIRRDQDALLASWFHNYLLIKGLIHRFLVMQDKQKSFPQFQILTDNTFRDGIEKSYRERFLQLSTCGDEFYLATIEGRFSPKRTMIENARIIKAIYKGYNEASKINPYLKRTQLQLVAHFIKQPEKKIEKKLPIRHRSLRKELERKAFALVKYMRYNKQQPLIVGVDAAANEMDAGPEVFAPIFRYLREKGIPHVTFHVGEDFRHILSGLRMIYEAIYFLDLQPGDRLGHCTALGINPKLWCDRTGDLCFVSQGEWLDDLVFVWELIKDSKSLDLLNLRLRIESSIRELSYLVYKKDYPPSVLSRAWKLRKHNPFIYLEKQSSAYRIMAMEDLEGVSEEVHTQLREDGIEELWRMYHYPGKTRNAYDKLIQISASSLVSMDDVVSLQNILLGCLAKKRIAIEALPTSNLRISYYRELKEYHLKRWLCQDQSDSLLPAVVLGTDDPGIFMTNIYNEYARAYLHLEECGISTMKRMELLSNLQNCSNVYKF